MQQKFKITLIAISLFLAILVGGLMLQQYFLVSTPKENFVLVVDESTPGPLPFSFNGTNPTIVVKLGTLVQITLINKGDSVHDFEIEALGVHLLPDVQPRGVGIVTFAASRAGNFTYICGIPEHEQLGMKGTLEVRQ